MSGHALAAVGAALVLCATAASTPVAAATAAAPTVAVRDEAPGFTLRSVTDDHEHSLAEHRGEGPVLLVFFRGAW